MLNSALSLFLSVLTDLLHFWCLQVGPAGAQFGLLACLIVEVLNVRPMLKHPNQALLKLLVITLVLLLFGLLPWIDNYAHLFGFIFGFLLSYALMPYVSFGPYDRHKKICLIWVCLLSSLVLFAALVILFYVIPVYDCEVCNIFNCLPLTRDFCASQNINFKREEPIVWRKWVRLAGTVCAINFGAFAATADGNGLARIVTKLVQTRTVCPVKLWLHWKWDLFKKFSCMSPILCMGTTQFSMWTTNLKFKYM